MVKVYTRTRTVLVMDCGLLENKEIVHLMSFLLKAKIGGFDVGFSSKKNEEGEYFVECCFVGQGNPENKDL